ncbi:hypothetical protein EJD97_014398 [Solanum chilense]|uniref:Uncharacterized protein n=1 Tax=Solanum chilense TaxID=4083 RepID=A0A6N2B8Y7_SOLCI|nr:hypothetical protein EJD97_014398 [Solanum chilense]
MELQKTLGIKTGGPSIPFLYSPSMGGISLMLHRAMTLHCIKGFKSGTTRLDRVKEQQYKAKIEERLERNLKLGIDNTYIWVSRVILIYSVLDSLPTYLMLLFPMPSSVKNNLNKIRRNLWNDNKEKRSFNLVRW